ncbi:MAG: HD domain-containing protein [Archaeoglobaceae archaeon]|nr:HD domain-containing protein [Archaeoglobaceae archaeon]MDW8118683.1 HD domain-containing protein [Archaeoglobaceae archaeon]
MEKTIQDPVHGLIKLEDWQISIIDTPQFQRLRRIKQLGFANLVYPGANHTRFEHSLGTMHLAGILAKKLDLGEEVIASALLHDISHPPFSHSGEGILKAYGKEHENIEFAIRGELKDVLEDLGFNLRRISELVSGKKESIVSGDIDVDRMDYLVRDSHYTGVAYGIFDISRLIDKIKFIDRLIVEEGGIKAAESLLISRFMMYPAVYFHHVCRIASKMFERAMERVLEAGFDPKKLFEIDDCIAMELIKIHDPEFYEFLQNRRLFKRAVYVGRESLDLKEIMKLNEGRIEEKIAENAGIDRKYVIVDIPPLEDVREFRVRVEIGGKIEKLENVSKLVRALKDSWIDNWRFGIYTKREFVEKVKRSAIEILGIEKTTQTSLF